MGASSSSNREPERRSQQAGPSQQQAAGQPNGGGYPGARAYPGAAAANGLVALQGRNGERIPLSQVQHNFLEGWRPNLAYGQSPLPQPMSQAPLQKTQTIRNDVNLKKNSIKLVPDEAQAHFYHLEFAFDASTDCSISVFYAATEHADTGNGRFTTLTEDGAHPKQTFAKGLGQTFRTRPEHPLDSRLFTPELLAHDASKGQDRFPIVICLEVAGPAVATSTVQSQTTFANLKVSADGVYQIAPLKQKIQVGSSCFELKEIFGKPPEQEADAAGGDDTGENGRDCVICMTEPRDTTVLPCRHMCLCSDCAKVHRLQSNKCPICRTNIESFLQIKSSKNEPKVAAAPAAESSTACSA